MALPMVAIVGRANVGKSTLFNRIVGERLSIVEDTPGVTRDRLYAQADWNGKNFFLIDTGGIELADADEIANLIRVQAQLAMDEADVIVFLVDGKTGMTAADDDVAKLLRRSGKPIVLAVNKIDHPNHFSAVYDFYALGFGEPIGISSEHGHGTGDLLDSVVDALPAFEEIEYTEDTIRIALIGRPNVGKSSLVNALLGQDRVMVSDVAGTTRDAVDSPLTADGQEFVLIDTAGIRRKGKVYERIEKYSVLRALRSIDRADVIFVVIDAESGIAEQDKKIAGYAVEAGRAVGFLVNKWDALEKDGKTAQRFTEQLRDAFPFMRWAPVLFVSAQTKQRIARILPMAVEISNNHALRISTSTFNAVLQEATQNVTPPSDRGVRLRIFYGTQVGVKPPSFALFVNRTDLLHFSYERYLENQFRRSFELSGTPIHIFARNRS